MQFFKKLFTTLKTQLNPIYMHDIPSQVNYKIVKLALQNESLSKVIGVFEFFKRFDPKISSELNKRRMQVARLPLIISSENKEQDKFLKNLVEKHDFKLLVFECTSAITYGFSSFLLEWENINGGIYPKMRYISPRYFESDEYCNAYIEQGSNRIYVEQQHEDIYTIYHPSDTGNIIESSLMNKIVSIASLKHIAMQRYMNYLDSFSVPPLILKSEAANSRETSDLILKAALNLRSNGVGLFAKEDTLDVLNGNVDKGTFLEFMRYCDECISKVITGQVLAGNSVQNGTQALGNVHEGIARNVLEFDAGILAENMRALLSQALAYNFALPAKFQFALDTNTEKDEKLQAEVYSLLSSMGIKIPLKHLETTFKIEGLEYKIDNFTQDIAQDFNADTSPKSIGSSANSIQDANTSTTQTEKIRSIELPITKLDEAIHSIPLESDFNIDEFIKDCKSYEEASQKIYHSFSGEELLMREEELYNYILHSQLSGMQS